MPPNRRLLLTFSTLLRAVIFHIFLPVYNFTFSITKTLVPFYENLRLKNGGFEFHLTLPLFSVTRLGDFFNFGNFLRPLATNNLPKSPTFLGSFCKVLKFYHFSSEIILGQLLKTFGEFFLVTLFLASIAVSSISRRYDCDEITVSLAYLVSYIVLSFIRHKTSVNQFIYHLV